MLRLTLNEVIPSTHCTDISQPYFVSHWDLKQQVSPVQLPVVLLSGALGCGQNLRVEYDRDKAKMYNILCCR